MNLYYQTKRT